MNQGRELTAEQVVEMAKSKLLQIYVPAGLSRSIGMPICEAVDMLTKLQEAWALDDARRNAELHELHAKIQDLMPQICGSSLEFIQTISALA